jgi:predicted nucleotidyltransferase
VILDNEEMIAMVAERLGALCEQVAFLGGATVSLFLTSAGAAEPRSTLDVDAIVRVSTRLEYEALSRKLRALRFKEDTSEGAPACRWLVDGVTIDLVPIGETVLGFGSRWFAEAYAHAELRTIAGISLKVVTAPYFVVTKLEAFKGRGRGDYAASQDIEDLIAVVDGRDELVTEVAEAEIGVRRYLAREIQRLLGNRRFRTTLPGHLPPDEGSQQRLSVVVERLQRLASLK